MSVNNSLVCWPLETYGTEEQKQKFLTPLAKGDLSLSLRPTEFDYYGRLELLGFSVLADGHAALNLLTSDSPELALHVLLATNQARVGQSDFGVIVSQAAAIPLNVIETTFLVIASLAAMRAIQFFRSPSRRQLPSRAWTLRNVSCATSMALSPFLVNPYATR